MSNFDVTVMSVGLSGAERAARALTDARKSVVVLEPANPLRSGLFPSPRRSDLLGRRHRLTAAPRRTGWWASPSRSPSAWPSVSTSASAPQCPRSPTMTRSSSPRATGNWQLATAHRTTCRRRHSTDARRTPTTARLRRRGSADVLSDLRADLELVGLEKLPVLGIELVVEAREAVVRIVHLQVSGGGRDTGGAM